MPGIDEELDQMKLTLDSLDDFLNRVARKLSEKMPSDLRKSLPPSPYQERIANKLRFYA
jgi:DNA mismatch repair protein MSH5